MTTNSPKKSDLGVRVLSAIVMVAVAGTALWLGGWFWTLFVAAVGLGVLWEWWGLVRGFVQSAMGRAAWLIGGLVYVGTSVGLLVAFRGMPDSGWLVLLYVLLGVIGTDIGAYFSGRTFGGPKIAPKVSPSKTWAGLIGGAIAASAIVLITNWAWHSGLCEFLITPYNDPSGTKFGFDGPCSLSLAPTPYLLAGSAIAGTFIAVVAQAGDFFESWMKRRAGVKDSGNLIPGHGGLFDRTDGMIAVLFGVGMGWLHSFVTSI